MKPVSEPQSSSAEDCPSFEARLAPAFAGIEMEMGERLIAKSVAIAADKSVRQINRAYKKDGIGMALRFPRVVGFIRDDKSPEDATTVKEIRELYRMQRKAK